MASYPETDASGSLSERGLESIQAAPEPQMSSNTPIPSSVLQEATKGPTVISSDPDVSHIIPNSLTPKLT